MIVLIGEAPGGQESIADRPGLALTGYSGRHLCLIAGWDWATYLRRTARYNLFMDPQPRWDTREAARRADGLEPLLVGRVILLGAKVARAFGVEGLGRYRWYTLPNTSFSLALTPHPSGRNRLWNGAAERERARAFLGPLLGA